MPFLENIEAITANSPPAPPAETEDPIQPQTARELTQTDHLNKRLLKSLLDSMKTATETESDRNEGDSSDGEFED